MPGRKYNSSEYRYGFNGKEKDQNGEFGSITNYDYGFRIYNPAVGRFLSVDPLTEDYPMLTPYQFASNSPIANIDLDGLESYYAADGNYLGKYGESTEIRVMNPESDTESIRKYLDNPKGHDSGIFKYFLPAFSTKAYRNPDQAAQDWAYEYNGKAHVHNDRASAVAWKVRSGRNKREYGVVIASKDTYDAEGNDITLWVLGNTVKHDQSQAPLELSSWHDWNRSGAVHTHPKGDKIGDGEKFSEKYDPTFPAITGDKFIADDYERFYLVTPQGYLKLFNTETDVGDVISSSIPHHPYSGRAAGGDSKPSFSVKYNNQTGDPIYKLEQHKSPTIKSDDNEGSN